MMKGIYAVSLLIVSNIFMTFAWYGHLKLQEAKVISNWPLYGVILFSWLIALAEYSCQVPANPARIQWKRRSLYVDAVESNSRGDYTDCVYCVFHLIV